MRRVDIKEILFLVTFWTACALFIRTYERALLAFAGAPTLEVSEFARDTLLVVLITAIGGLIAATIDVLLLVRWFTKKTFATTLLARTVYYVACIFVLTSIGGVLVHLYQYDRRLTDPVVWDWYTRYLSSPRVVLLHVYWGAAAATGLAIVMVRKKYGRGAVASVLRGRFYRPREEKRIFMFLDMKSSTAHAERLGHVLYSCLIRDCFNDLSVVVVRHHAAVYQYVGDEAVLTWRLSDGVRHANCVRLFFAYGDALRGRGDHYEHEYGFVPEFKAGLHVGRVMVAEVGGTKKELAYHGDVVNLAARIQSKCNELGASMLLSESLVRLLGETSGIVFRFADRVRLRGISRPIKIYRAEAVGANLAERHNS